MDLAPLFPVPFILLAVVAHEYEKTERSMWVHDINLKRGEVGEYFHLFPDLLNNEKTFFKYFRMSAEKFFELFELLPLKKMDTNYRKAVSPAERLAVTLKIYQKLIDYSTWVIQVGLWDMACITYSFEVICCMYGREQATHNVLYIWDPQFTFALSNSICLGVILFNLIPWDYYLLTGLRKCSKLPVVGGLMPRHFDDEPAAEQPPSDTERFLRLVGRLPIPSITLCVGQLLFPKSSAVSQMLCGAAVIFTSSTLLKMYYTQRKYVRNCTLTIANYDRNQTI